MKEIKEKLKQILYWQLTFMERDRECMYTDWGQARRGIERHLLPKIANLIIQLMEEKEETIRELEESNRKLSAKLNLRTGNNPERDQRIRELYKQGLSRGQIAKEVSMSKWGVSKALRRLGVNSVAISEKSSQN